jgi:single-strand DNA-binding protein
MQESGPDYGTDGGFGQGSGGSEPRRVSSKSGGGGAKGGFDKALDDEIPF